MGFLTIRGNLTGIAPVTRKLAGIKRGLRNRILRKALTRGIKPLAEHGKWLAPVSHAPPLVAGLLRKAMGTKVVAKGDRAFGLAGPRLGFKRQIAVRTKGKHVGEPVYQDPAKYGPPVEGGHGGPAPAPPHAFLSLAWQAGKAEAEAAIAGEIEAGIREEAAKA